MTPIVAIVGRPNVGKSTLFNRLVGYKKAIVDDYPGVTRDRNYETVEIDGRSVTFVDTGGYDPLETDGIMAQVREQALTAIDEADLIVVLADGKQGLNPNDRELVDILRRSQRPFLLAVNKIDGPEKEVHASEFHELGVDNILTLSAAHGYGVAAFFDAVLEHLPPAEETVEDENVIRVAVIGRPNVGKSSLINRLAGVQRSVVNETPGTTRDALDITVVRGDRKYVFVDTAGIRRKGKVSAKVEKFSIMQALRAMDRCDVALLMVDSQEGLTDQDAHVAGYAADRGRGLILLFNKWDLVKDKAKEQKRVADVIDLKLRFLTYAPVITISALTGMRVEKIFGAVEEIYKQYTVRVPTPQLNRVLETAVTTHTPPYVGRTRLKFYYATQASTRPPVFVVFANRPESVHFSYQRFLSNTFREAFGMDKIPIKLIFRPRRKEQDR